jgi:hypothetical protein
MRKPGRTGAYARRSVKQLSEATGMSEAEVIVARQQLIDAGWLTVRDHGGAKGDPLVELTFPPGHRMT